MTSIDLEFATAIAEVVFVMILIIVAVITRDDEGGK